MRKLRRSLLALGAALAASFLLALPSAPAQEQPDWVHVEWGGINTVNPAWGWHHDHTLHTLEALVRRHGPDARGVFYINDLEWPKLAAEAARVDRYCRKHGWDIEVRALPGDYTRIRAPRSTSASLKLPPHDFGGDIAKVQRLADASDSGLEIGTVHDGFIRDAIADGRADGAFIRDYWEWQGSHSGDGTPVYLIRPRAGFPQGRYRPIGTRITDGSKRVSRLCRIAFARVTGRGN